MNGLHLATMVAIGVLVFGSIAIFVWFLVDVVRLFEDFRPPDE